VLIQRKHHGHWKTVRRLHAGAHGSESAFGRRLRIFHGGRYRAVVVITDGSGASAVSASVRVR
jgi:hypothetical protein